MVSDVVTAVCVLAGCAVVVGVTVWVDRVWQRRFWERFDRDLDAEFRDLCDREDW